MLTDGCLLYNADIHKMPVLASAAIAKIAKYNERKGFLLNHLYPTLITASSASNLFSLSPAKYADGSFVSKNNLKENGDAKRFLKLLKFGFKMGALKMGV